MPSGAPAFFVLSGGRGVCYGFEQPHPGRRRNPPGGHEDRHRVTLIVAGIATFQILSFFLEKTNGGGNMIPICYGTIKV